MGSEVLIGVNELLINNKLFESFLLKMTLFFIKHSVGEARSISWFLKTADLCYGYLPQTILEKQDGEVKRCKLNIFE